MSIFFSQKKSLLVACTLGLFHSTGLAAPVEEFQLDQMIITATRTPLEEKKVPQSVEVIDAAEIKRLGAYNVTDALRLATGIEIGQAGMTGKALMVRGMDSNKSLVLVDGKRTAGEDTNMTTNVYELDRINVSDIERIEIVRGPGSAMYGSDAMAGVINIIMKKSFKPSGMVGFGAGKDENNAYLSYSSGQQGKWSFKTAARLTDVREITFPEGSDTNMYGTKRYLNFNADYALAENKTISFETQFVEEQLRSKYANKITKPPMEEGANNKIEWYNNNRSSYAVSYNGYDNRNDYMIRAYYSLLKKESRQKNYIPKYLANNYWADFDHMRYEKYVVEGKNSFKIDESHTLTYGGEYVKTQTESTRMGEAGRNQYVDEFLGMKKNASEETTKTYAGYVQDEWQISDKLFIIPSLRYDHHNSFGSNITPKLGATYSFNENTRLKTSYGKGYRAPTIYELYADMHRKMGPMEVIIHGNPDLKPEKSNSWEISLEGERGDNWGKITYFNNDIKNLIDAMQVGPGPIEQKYFNIAKAQINGVETEIGHKLNKNFTVKATYNWLDAVNETDDRRLTNRAKHRGTVQLKYSDNTELPFTITLWNEWNVDYYYSRGSGNNLTYHNATFNTTNFVVNKEWNKKLNTYFGIDNLFDKKIDDLNYAGRFWRIGAEYNF
ncbi:MAG TPA: TonB-dependent receptor [Candidatus Avacidaminococcus intestinavium]|uniref:TonB-dependent receptor n=1 Tax=Candidatus Avacidaminococcus intestinavium TaxID=2840684 RepID=A0A9D1MP11_9FIRM|nr:TonB-dependent receptor [Candidatus Avacidaminococcus intestinavium]